MIVYRILDNITDEKESASDLLGRLRQGDSMWRIHTRRAGFVDKCIQSWVDRQTRYLRNLSWEDQATIIAYTYDGHAIVNTFLRREFDWRECARRGFVSRYDEFLFPIALPLFFRSWKEGVSYGSIIRWFWENRRRITDAQIHTVMKAYIQRLSRIIRNAPPAPRNMTVYRGINGKHFLLLDRERSIITPSFLSSTLSVKEAKSFIPMKRACCLQRIHVHRGHPVLFVAFLSYYPNELEILFLPDSKLVDLNNNHTLGGKDRVVRVLEYQIRS